MTNLGSYFIIRFTRILNRELLGDFGMEQEMEYGIRYGKLPLGEKEYILYPVDIVQGYCVNDDFCSDTIYHKPSFEKALEEENYLVDNIFSLSHLQEIYHSNNKDDQNFLLQFFWETERQYILYVTVQDGKVVERKVDLHALSKVKEETVYRLDQDSPTVTLNSESLSQLLSEPDVNRVRCRLLALSDGVKKTEVFGPLGVVGIAIEGDTLKGLYLDNNIAPETIISNQTPAVNPDISLRGLETYMKERVFGHDDEISQLATTIYMNYTALPDEKTESILLVGPTGTGKTQTIRAAMEYLNLPMVELKGSTFVPPGIKGTSLEDGFFSLLSQCDSDLSMASRGIVYIDEFDKIGEQCRDYVSAIMNVIMNFIEGDPFYFRKTALSNQVRMFPTNSLHRIFSGTFSNLFNADKKIGFGAVNGPVQFDASRLSKETAFNKELVSRFPHLVVYNVLDHETKLDILQHSRSSVFQKKKARYERQFQVETKPDMSYFDALLAKLDESDQSMRDLNNIVMASLTSAEHEMALEPAGTYKVLKLTKETVSNPKKFDLS